MMFYIFTNAINYNMQRPTVNLFIQTEIVEIQIVIEAEDEEAAEHFPFSNGEEHIVINWKERKLEQGSRFNFNQIFMF